MPNKTCTKCKEDKSVTDFHKRPYESGKVKYRSHCKACRSAYYYRTRDQQRATKRAWREKNKEKLKEYYKKRYAENKEEISEKAKARRAIPGNKEKNTRRNKAWREKNKEKLKAKYETSGRQERKRYYDRVKHTEAYKTAEKTYRERTREQRKVKSNQTRNHRYHNDPVFRMRVGVSKQVRRGLKRMNVAKENSTWSRLPYSPQKLKEHLESLFEPWMSWDNYGNKRGDWSIDHIVPHSSFKFDSMDHPDFQKCWSLENLRPLDHWENMKKGNRTSKDEEDAE